MRRTYLAAAALLIVGAGAVYLWRVPADPPGFYIDESSICYNAHTIGQTGRDEYGVAWPVFFRAFGEYKNPTLVYLLAGLFKLTGPSIAAARLLTASLGLLASALLGVLAWRMTNRFVVAAAIAVSGWLTPWLFECSRVVLEVAIYPSLLVLFLLAAWRASTTVRWRWREIMGLAATLGLLTYSYSIGRLLGPLLALGLAFLLPARRWRDLLRVWLSYGVLLLPMLVFQQRHPGALTNRFRDLTYLTNDKPFWAAAAQFLRRYVADINPWRWLASGGTDVRDHVPNTGSMLAIVVVLGVAGLWLVLRDHPRERWWRFVLYGLLVAVIPAALTRNEFSQLRLIAFPVFFVVLTIPAVAWLASRRQLVLAAAVAGIVGQGIYFQWLYHRSAPNWWYVFDARFPRKVLAPALAANRNGPVYLVDEAGKSGYIQALWHGALMGIDSGGFVRVPPDTQAPPSAVVISTEENCRDCRLIARSLNYIVYAVPPYLELQTEPRRPLDVFRASILAPKAPTTLKPGQNFSVELLVRNPGPAEWPAVGDAEGRFAVEVVGRWRGKTPATEEHQPFAKSLPYDVEPGDTFGLSFEMTAPQDPGEYCLEFDLFQEGVGSFADHGSEPLRVTVRVADIPL
jgi:hypothetical protein